MLREMRQQGPSKELLEAWRRDGFVNVGPMLNAVELAELRSEMDRFIDAAFSEGAPEARLPFIARNLSDVPGQSVHQFVNLWEVSPVFRRTISHPAIVEAAAALAGTDTLQVWYDQAQCKPPSTGGATEWHQDAQFWQPIRPSIALTAWIALDDAEVDNGCMWMVPGSHLWGDRAGELMAQRGRHSTETFGDLPPIEPPASAPAWIAPRPCPVRAGEVHFHHCLTWHGSPLNRSARVRRAFGVHYLPTGVKFVGHPGHPLGSRIRLAEGAAMLEDPERFPVVYADGRAKVVA
jgi:ectoine hydroxylase-related dioxygenase (phytanoyl-CoA dioxygenase family)